MSVITKLPAGRSREKRVNVFLDGRFAFSLLAEVAATEGLRVGQELSEGQIEALTGSDRYQRCLNAAIHFLGYRPRSEAEVRQRLQRRGFEDNYIEKVIARLKEQGLVDDAAFARFWVENRDAFRPRSRRLTGLELLRKGLAGDVIAQVAATLDDGESAYRAAASKARRLLPSEYRDFRRRLGEHLRRRGFDYDLINKTVDRLWKEFGVSP